MTDAVVVRRVRLHEWREVRDLRLAAVADPAASVAFLTTMAEETARDEAFWRERTAGGAMSDHAAQFVAVDGGRWVGTATVLLRDVEDDEPRADIVGVFVAPTNRGSGILERLLDAAGDFAAARGRTDVMLDVHADNTRAQRAYRRCGFSSTGVTSTSVIGPQIELRRSL